MADVQYRSVVSWDANIVDVGFMSSDNTVPSALAGLAIDATQIVTGAPAATVGHWIPGAIIQNAIDGTVYQNRGTTAAPVWALVDRSPFVDQFAGQVTGGTTATRAYTVTGILATDAVVASIQASQNAVTIQKVTASANTITVLFSGDPGTGTTINYIAARSVS